MDTSLQIQGRAECKSFWDLHRGNVFKGSNDPEYSVIWITPYRIEVWQEGGSGKHSGSCLVSKLSQTAKGCKFTGNVSIKVDFTYNYIRLTFRTDSGNF